jgi:hypothetical protein
MNSVYDVDTSLGSTTTPGFTEWSAFFNNYRVWRLHVRAEITISGVSSGGIATVCLVPNSFQATLPSSAIDWSVQPQAIHRTITPIANGGSNLAVLDKEYWLPRIFRITDSQFRDDMDFTATTGSNPSRQAYFAVTVQGLNSANAATLNAQLYFAMEIEFFNPIQLST